MFTGSFNSVVCITPYRQCAQSDILYSRNIEVVNKVILFNLNIYYRQENCVLPGYYAANSVNLTPTFRNKQSLSSSRDFISFSFETNYGSQLQVILAFRGKILLMIGDNISVNLMCILGISGNYIDISKQVPDSRVCAALSGSLLPTFWDNISVAFSRDI